MPELTAKEVSEAFDELKLEVKKGRIETEKMDKIDVVLDAWETKSSEIVTANAAVDAQKLEIKELTESLEKKGVENSEVNKRVDELEASFARNKSIQEGGTDFTKTDEYKAMVDWAREGPLNMGLENKALLRTDSAVDGGVLTTTEMDPVIVKKITEIDEFRSLARVRTISNKSIELPIRSSIPTATYEGEAEAASESASKYENVTITPYRQTFQTPVTKDQLMDSAFNMESEITLDAAEAFAFGEGNGFIVGNGTKQPDGIATNAVLTANGTRVESSGAALIAEDFMTLQGALLTGYNASFLLSRGTLTAARKLRGGGSTTTDGPFLFNPGLDGMPNTLAGSPYRVMQSMPAATTGLFPVAYGDFLRGYTIVDRTGFSIIRDEFTRASEGIIVFTMARWNTGLVTLTEAIKLLHLQ